VIRGKFKMRYRLGEIVAVSVLAALAFSPAVLAQGPPVPAGTGMMHDMTGVWGLAKVRDQVNGMRRAEPAAPMTPEGQAKFDFNTHELKEGRPITIDPAYTCHWPGLPHIYFSGAYAFEIVQTPQRIFIFYENTHQWREVWMDGREIPADSDPLWMGYSVGHWDGNDLVVVSASFNDKSWLDVRGHAHSDALKLTERYHRGDHDHMQVSFTIDDPKMYTGTWEMRNNFDLKPTWQIGEAFCVVEDQAQFFHQSLQEPGGKATPDK
jgi:hypothetical protein